MPITPNVYQIHKEHHELTGFTTLEIIEHIVNRGRLKLQFDKAFDENDLSTFQREDFTYHLFLMNTSEHESDWSEFLPEQLTADNDFTQQKLSLLLFIETEFQLYVVVGGSAYTLIIPYIDHAFGITAYDRIVEPDKDELTSIRTRGITGQRIGMNEQFRNEYRMINFTRFGKLPKEIHVKLCRESTDIYFPRLKNKERERLQLTVGAGFRIGKNLDFDGLHQLIEDLTIVATHPPKEYLSSYQPINDNEEIHELRKLLIHKLYNNLAVIYNGSRLASDRFDFDFCNPNRIDLFYEAETYQIKEKTEEGGYKLFATLDNREDIFHCVMDRAVETVGMNSEYKFSDYLWGVHIAALKGDKVTTSSGFMFHFGAELSYKNSPVFLIDTKWYFLKEQFITDLITNAQHIFRTYRARPEILKFPWNRDELAQEREYNILYDTEPDYIVCDALIVDGVELCDVMYYDKKNLYLCHVKAGFNSKVRELTNQIQISARRLKEAINGNNSSFLDHFYDKLINSGRDYNDLTLSKFKRLFKKNINYLLAISSTLVEDLPIEDYMDKYDSNIARFSLIQCSQEMTASFFPLSVYQIPRYEDLT
ncbi:DUF6119 family protein [Mucilaginibacter aquaedulcis]|uniref:DUF6119 family protein n=1 Tax=Mucilaginibacter aquaedulcis TaxID=1187081 RepID=UPI0025B4FD32|nr:DUF6119 family protein [Mucilaginibacter aquaedulcis]MDN3550507.1 hypothetical protein [Mucilaginibacter aquaedulcis]